MRIFTHFITVIATLLMGVPAFAQTSVELSAPRTVTAGQRFSITVTVNNPDGRVADFKGPTLVGCSFLGGPGVSSSSYTSIINGRMQSSKSTGYTFQYLAEKEGTVNVPSVEVKVDGKSYSTSPTQFTVMGGGQPSPSQGGQGSQGQPQQRQRQSGDFQIGAKDLFIRIALSQQSVYESQAVECDIKLYSSNGQVNSIVAASVPTFDGCLIENIGMPSNIDWHSETVDGRQYYAATIYRALLYPQRSGDITLKGGEYNVSVYRQVMVQDFFFQRPEMQEKNVTLKPTGAVLHVKALPEPRPAGFSGAVGQFSASARLVGSTFKTNEASSLIFTIEGTGNIKFLTEPKIDFPSEFEVYDPHVETSAHVSGRNMTGSQTIEYTFVPQSVGKFAIGRYDFIYFNPANGQYVTVPVEGYEIDVEKGADVSNGAVTPQSDILTKNTDIHYIKPSNEKPGSVGGFMARSTLYWLMYPLLALIVAGILTVMAKRNNVDQSTRRLNKAGKAARRRLARAGQLLKAGSYEEFYAELMRAMHSYLSDKLQLPASQLNRDNIETTLRTRGVDEETLRKINGILDECEMARYTPGLASENAQADYEQAQAVINDIEKTLK